MLQYRVKESGEVVKKVVVLRVVVGNQQCIPIFSQPFGNRWIPLKRSLCETKVLFLFNVIIHQTNRRKE